MNDSRWMEIIVGFFVVIGIAALLFLSMKVSNLGGFENASGYSVYAYFNDIGGLKVGAPVTAAGVKVGRVTGIEYNNKNYEAKVTMMIDSKYGDFPVDSTISIYTAGLLGEQYIAISPGAASQYLKNGSQIQFTQSAVVLEKVIGKLMSSFMSK